MNHNDEPISTRVRAIVPVTVRMAIFGLLLVSCDHSSGGKDHEWSRRLTDTRTILGEESAGETLAQCTRRVPSGVTGYWTPSPALVSQVDARLMPVASKALKHAARMYHTEPLSADEYDRQYVGVMHGIRRAVYINAIHRGAITGANGEKSHAHMGVDSLAWRRRAISVCDGGIYYFGIEFDVESKTFGQVEFNDRV